MMSATQFIYRVKLATLMDRRTDIRVTAIRFLTKRENYIYNYKKILLN